MERTKEMEIEKIDEEPGRMTEWLSRKGACGPTGYPNCRLNVNWCQAEVERLKAKGVNAKIVENDKGKIAIFRVEG